MQNMKTQFQFSTRVYSNAFILRRQNDDNH